MSLRLLVLDDDRSLLALLRAYFAGIGWHVEACSEAPEALRLADSDSPFDAVICDLHFTPARLGEGFDIASRARRRRPQSAVLLFTGDGADVVREEARRCGVDEVVVKPAPLARLRDAALRAMKKP